LPALSGHPDALLPDHVLDVEAAVVLDQVVGDAVAGGPGDHDVHGLTGVVVRTGARAAPTEGLDLGELRAHGPVAVDGVGQQARFDRRGHLGTAVRRAPFALARLSRG